MSVPLPLLTWVCASFKVLCSPWFESKPRDNHNFWKTEGRPGKSRFFALPRPFAHCLGGQLELRHQVQGMAPLQATLAGGDGAVVGEQIAQDPRLPHLPQQPGAQNPTKTKGGLFFLCGRGRLAGNTKKTPGHNEPRH